MYSVAVWKTEGAYCAKPPFHPSEPYPEFLANEVTLSSANPAYAGVRELLHALGYDEDHFGTATWNPFGWLVKPGQTVLLKPNLVREDSLDNRGQWQHVITHGSVVRAVMDYVYIALRGQGCIQVADAPQGDSNISMLRRRFGIDEIIQFYSSRLNFKVEFIDLRDECWQDQDGVFTNHRDLPGDPLGTQLFDLGSNSYFAEIDHLQRRYYGAFYDIPETNRHHSNGYHEYKIARSPLAADVFISIPKLKTHKKVGVTLNLKGLVGINGDKNYLPHYAIGSPERNGDQFPGQSPAIPSKTPLWSEQNGGLPPATRRSLISVGN